MAQSPGRYMLTYLFVNPPEPNSETAFTTYLHELTSRWRARMFAACGLNLGAAFLGKLLWPDLYWLSVGGAALIFFCMVKLYDAMWTLRAVEKGLRLSKFGPRV